MIFTGDIAAPEVLHSNQLAAVFNKYPSIFKNTTLICNFEGLLYEGERLQLNKPVLYNHPSVLKTLTERGKVVAGLANNHILDLPSSYDRTKEALTTYGIDFGGAGRNMTEASQPICFVDDGREIILYNACWDFLLYHQKNPSNGIYISEIKESKLLKSITTSRKEKPEVAIIVFLHWSFDLETLPFPMYRQFAKKLIDEGANIIIGSHSHCVQGGEKHKDGYIIYGLGNFFMPQKVFANGKVMYPEFSRTELVFEWNSSSNQAICHWFEYQCENTNHILNHLGSEEFDNSKILKKFSPFTEMSEKEYLTYFKLNRRKKFLIPIYSDCTQTIRNSLKTLLLKQRAKFARILAKFNIIKWQN